MNQNNNEPRISIPIKRLSEDLIIPKSSKTGDAGADARIVSFKNIINEDERKELIEIKSNTYTLKPLERIGCLLGFATAIPEGFYFKVVPRSGLALWQGLSIVNTPGTIDSDYRGEIKIIVINLSKEDFAIKRGDRIAQIIFSPVVKAHFERKAELDPSERGSGGFGSTGI